MSPGAIARPQRPHHRTCRSASGGSRNTRESLILLQEAHESQSCEQSVGQRRVHVWSHGVTPRPTTIARSLGLFVGHTKGKNLLQSSAARFPLAPLNVAQMVTYPAIELVEMVLDPTEPKVRDPTAGDAVDSLDGVRKFHAASLPEQRLELGL